MISRHRRHTQGLRVLLVLALVLSVTLLLPFFAATYILYQATRAFYFWLVPTLKVAHGRILAH